MERKTGFTYTSLNTEKREIRLVQLQPCATSSENISCTILSKNLDDEPVYEALSYEWGPPDGNRLEITIDGQVVKVRENLWWALYHLRHDGKARCIWIDALCINQNDTKERNHQVAQMKSIYSGAKSVIAWVGRETTRINGLCVDEAKTAIPFLHELTTTPFTEFPYSDRTGLKRTPHALKWDALEVFCKRSYWSRLWIVQEVVLANELWVQCGRFSVSWRGFYRLFSEAGFPGDIRHPTGQNFLVPSIPSRLQRFRSSETRLPTFSNDCGNLNPLATLVAQFSVSDCQDIRDKVYGVLSLAKICCQRAVPADYGKSLIQIYGQLLEHHILCHVNPDGEQTLAACQMLQRALKLEVTAATPPSDDAQKARKQKQPHLFRPLRHSDPEIKLPLGTSNAGKIVWLSSTNEGAKARLKKDDHCSQHPLFPFLTRYLHSMYDEETPIASLEDILYFNPLSEHPCKTACYSSQLDTSRSEATPSRKTIDRNTYQIPLDSQSKLYLEDSQEEAEYAQKNSELRLLVPDDSSLDWNFESRPKESRSYKFLKNAEKRCHLRKLRLFLTSTVMVGCVTPQARLGSRPKESRSYKFLKNAEKGCHLRKLRLFLTSTGMVGCVTPQARLGDRVCKISGGWRQLAIIRKTENSCYVIGKGLETVPRVYVETEYILRVIPKHEILLQVDIGTLMFLTGYF